MAWRVVKQPQPNGLFGILFAKIRASAYVWEQRFTKRG